MNENNQQPQYQQPQYPQGENQQIQQGQYYQQPVYMPQQPVKKKKPLHKKWWFWLIIVIVAIAIISSLGSSDDTTQNGETTNISEVETQIAEGETSKKQEKAVYAFDDVELKYKSSKVVKEEYGDDYYLIVNFDYTNNSSDTQAFDDCVTIKAFQSGVELQKPFSTYGIPDYDFHYSEKEVKPGVTLTVQEAFRLDDRNNTVSIEIYDGVYFIDKPEYQFDVEIKK